MQIIIEYLHIWDIMLGVQLSDTPDHFIWRWEPSGNCSSSRRTAPSLLRLKFWELWKTRAPNKCHLFFWLVVHNRCWTSDRLQRHNLRNDVPRALCAQSPEQLDHLLIGCVYSREVWFRVLRKYDWHQFAPNSDALLIPWWLATRKRICKERRKAFDSIVVLTAWNIWLQRNTRVFRQQSVLTAHLVVLISDSANEWCLAGLIHRSSLGLPDTSAVQGSLPGRQVLASNQV